VNITHLVNRGFLSSHPLEAGAADGFTLKRRFKPRARISDKDPFLGSGQRGSKGNPRRQCWNVRNLEMGGWSPPYEADCANITQGEIGSVSMMGKVLLVLVGTLPGVVGRKEQGP